MKKSEILEILKKLRNDENYRLIEHKLTINGEYYIYVNEIEKIGYIVASTNNDITMRTFDIINMGHFTHKPIPEKRKSLVNRVKEFLHN